MLSRGCQSAPAVTRFVSTSTSDSEGNNDQSAPAGELYRFFGITAEKVAAAVKGLL